MAGHSRLKDGVASACLVPAIHVFLYLGTKDVDARHKAGHDEFSYRGPGPRKAKIGSFAYFPIPALTRGKTFSAIRIIDWRPSSRSFQSLPA
jgi:hypothetical protein